MAFKAIRSTGGPVHSHDRTLIAKLGFADADKQDPRHDLACEYLATDNRLLTVFEFEPLKPRDNWQETVGTRLLLPKGQYAKLRDGHYVGSLPPQFVERHGWAELDDEDAYPVGSKVKLRSSNSKAPLVEVATEVAVSKGEGQYKTTVGFLDLKAVVTLETSFEVEITIQAYTHLPRKKKKAIRAGYIPLEERVEEEAATGYIWNRWDHCKSERNSKRFQPTSPVAYNVTERTIEYKSLIVEVKIKPTSVGDMIRQINLYREYVGAIPGRHFREPEHEYDERVEEAALAAANISWGIVTDFDLDTRAISSLERENIVHARLGPAFNTWLKKPSKKAATRIV